MTVQELMRMLEQCPPLARVYADGCDCTGAASGVELYQDPLDGGPVALVSRTADGLAVFVDGKEVK